jgi:bifunctional DNA-binding transcriptional regulator/antitoxin component of YhaV-PrlF toxin-antitoxin module
METPTVEVAKRGVVTIPKSIRDANKIQEGQQYSVHDLGEGVLLFSPRISQIDAMCDDLRTKLIARGASLEQMLEDLRRHREGAGA